MNVKTVKNSICKAKASEQKGLSLNSFGGVYGKD